MKNVRDEAPKTKGQRTQQKIIEQALKLFGKNGFANTSMQMIATACDLSQGAVMQHFPSKARLLEATRRQVTTSNHEYVDSRINVADDGLTALHKHLALNVEWATRHPAEASIIVLTYENAIHDDEYREIARAAARLGTERIYRYLLAGQREKLIDGKLDAEKVAPLLQSYLFGLLVTTIATNSAHRLNRNIDEQIHLLLKRLLEARKT